MIEGSAFYIGGIKTEKTNTKNLKNNGHKKFEK
jgi:hypothetical protein